MGLFRFPIVIGAIWTLGCSPGSPLNFSSNISGRSGQANLDSEQTAISQNGDEQSHSDTAVPVTATNLAEVVVRAGISYAEKNRNTATIFGSVFLKDKPASSLPSDYRSEFTIIASGTSTRAAVVANNQTWFKHFSQVPRNIPVTVHLAIKHKGDIVKEYVAKVESEEIDPSLYFSGMYTEDPLTQFDRNFFYHIYRSHDGATTKLGTYPFGSVNTRSPDDLGMILFRDRFRSEIRSVIFAQLSPGNSIPSDQGNLFGLNFNSSGAWSPVVPIGANLGMVCCRSMAGSISTEEGDISLGVSGPDSAAGSVSVWFGKVSGNFIDRQWKRILHLANGATSGGLVMSDVQVNGMVRPQFGDFLNIQTKKQSRGLGGGIQSTTIDWQGFISTMTQSPTVISSNDISHGGSYHPNVAGNAVGWRGEVCFIGLDGYQFQQGYSGQDLDARLKIYCSNGTIPGRLIGDLPYRYIANRPPMLAADWTGEKLYALVQGTSLSQAGQMGQNYHIFKYENSHWEGPLDLSGQIEAQKVSIHSIVVDTYNRLVVFGLQHGFTSGGPETQLVQLTLEGSTFVRRDLTIGESLTVISRNIYQAAIRPQERDPRELLFVPK